MKKNIIIALVLLFALSFTVFADSVSLNPTSLGHTSVDQNAVVSGNFTVTNNGANNITQLVFELDSAKLNGSQEDATIAMSFVPPQDTNLLVGASQDVNYSFTMPETFAGAYAGIINIKNASSDIISTLPISVTVNSNSSLGVTAASTNAIAGETTTINMTFTNTGNTHISNIVVSPATLTKTGGSDTITNAVLVNEGTAFNVDYEQSKSMPVKITIPSGKSGSYTANITANYDSKTVSAVLTVNIQAAEYESTISVDDVVWVEGSTTSLPIEFTIENTGNKALTNEECQITAFKQGSTEKIGTNYFSSYTTIITSLAVDATTDKTFTLQSIPSSLDLGDYTATISCDHAASNETVTLTYRNPLTSLDVDSTLNFGSSSSPATRNETATLTFNITNDGDVDVDDVELRISNPREGIVFSANEDTTYNIGDINAGEQKSVTMEVFVDYDLDGGKTDLGTLQISSVSLDSTITSDINVYVESMLKIEDAKIEVDGDDTTIMPDDDKTVDVEPGCSIDIDIDVKSLYSENDDYEEDIDIDDVEVNVVIDKLDIDETSDSVSLIPEDDDTISVSFDLPYDLEKDTYILEITVSGEDSEGAEHLIEWTVDLSVNRETRELKILTDQTAFVDNEVETDDIAYLNVKAMNTGDKRLDNVALEIKCDDLGFSHRITEDDLSTDYGDDDNVLEVNDLAIDLEELGATAKTYTFTIKSYYSNTKTGDTYRLDLTCVAPTASSSGSSSSDTDTTNIISIGKDNQAGSDDSTSGTDTSTESSSMFSEFKDSAGYITILVVGMLAVIGLFIWAVMKL